MSETTSRLALPFIMTAQAQKHITHNEALRLLDGLVQMRIINATSTTPPSAPDEGDAYIIAAPATDVWTDWEKDVAFYTDGSWFRFPAIDGMRAWDAEASTLLVYTVGSWKALPEALNLLKSAPLVQVAKGPLGGTTGLGVLEETLASLSGSSVATTIAIPDRSICFGVSTRTMTVITGATSFDCGINGEPSKFGGSLGVAAGSTNLGIIGPQGFYADTPIHLTANGGDFTGGTVSVAIHYLSIGVLDAP
ncbi:DUF2793 domain-containing protein [Pseudovibrio sp. Tun.PSC04-5.I4]|uniref:DUF2793 domain-containing protein n=1 Tax=Pseudovibrio sp. Tun.PSC04-5.I4 TaxID=1798213 RepID=UPI00088E3F43|nr:DUF2793 domain-containing protein [Pseudovibrio sp. Tun.PSC04-5.I4]SDR39816.1 Protein of unknown function [Pseudovibrio sp. Tun.PSC04-5.I4]